MSDRFVSCAKIEPDLVAAAAGEAGATARERVDAHVARCGSCRDELGRYRALEDQVAELRTVMPPGAQVAASRDKLEARLLDLRSRLLAYRVVPTALGDVLIARSELGVALVEYLGNRGARQAREAKRPREVRTAGRREQVELVEDREELAGLADELGAYLAGRRHELRWPLDLRFVRTDFQREVLARTAEIPYGAVVSYKGLAQDMGRPHAVRAVAQALRWNPVPIVVPCHRVVGADGALVGYAGPHPERKRTLLGVEGVPVTAAGRTGSVRRELMYVLAPGEEREYCLPSCSPTTTLSTGATLFGSRAQAEARGLVPCVTCRPDLHPLAAPLSLFS